jgi:hypothetical protein
MGKFKKGITNDNDTQQISYINIEQKKEKKEKRIPETIVRIFNKSSQNTPT